MKAAYYVTAGHVVQLGRPLAAPTDGRLTAGNQSAWLSAVGYVREADQNVSKSVTESSGLWLIGSDWRKVAVRYSKYVLGAYQFR